MRAIVEASVGWCLGLCCNSQNAVKRHHWPESAVESEYKFVEVCLQVLRTDSVVSSQQPGIKISKNYVNHRQVGFGFRLVALDGQWIVTVTELRQVVIAGPTISANNGVRGHRCENEGLQFFLAPARHHFKAQPSGNDTATVPTPVGLRLPGGHIWVGAWSFCTRTHLYRAYDQCLMVMSSTLSLCGATYPLFIHLNRPLPTNSISLRANHCNTQFVQHLECCFVAAQTELPLELQRTHSWSLSRNKVCRPKPDIQRQA